MPKGVYRKKTKRGWMHFRDGKLISKASYDRSKRSKRSTRKGQVRKTARRAYMKRGKNMSRRKTIPHPSITGMASGLAIASYLNAGRETTTQTGITGVGEVVTMGEGVIKDVTDGELGKSIQYPSRKTQSI